MNNMTMDEAMNIVSGCAHLELDKIRPADLMRYTMAFVSYAEALKPLYDRYIRQCDSGDIDALIDAYLKEQGEK